MKKLSLFLAIIITSVAILSGCSTPFGDGTESDTLITSEQESIGDTVTDAEEKTTDKEGDTAGETFSETVIEGTDITENDTYETGGAVTETDLTETGTSETESESGVSDTDTEATEPETDENETESETETLTSSVINFFMINDNHGVFVSDGGACGVERIATLLYKSESAKGESIKIANGDIFQGTYVSSTLRGEPMIDALNEMEFDCFVIGNHEFDWGLDVIARYADGNEENGEADFPFLGANIYEKSTGERVEWLRPYAIVENNGVKVGVIGVIGPGLENSILASKVENYVFVDYVELVAGYASELRSLGCEVVVLATHEYEESSNESVARLTGDAAIDAIFCAHTHQKIDETVKRSDGYYIPVVQNYGNGGTATRLELTVDGDTMSSEVYQYNIEDYILDVQMTENVVNKYAEIITASNSVIGYTKDRISKDELGYIATDAMVKAYGADVGIINTGGVRATIGSGNISVADVFSVFPFENAVVLVPMTGAQIKSLYSKSGSYLYFNSDFDANSFTSTSTYTVAVIDYVYESAYYQYAFGNTTPEYTPDVMRDVIIDAFKADYFVSRIGYYEYAAA